MLVLRDLRHREGARGRRSLLDKVQAKTAGVIADAVKAKVHGKLTQKDGEH